MSPLNLGESQMLKNLVTLASIWAGITLLFLVFATSSKTFANTELQNECFGSSPPCNGYCQTPNTYCAFSQELLLCGCKYGMLA
jgi:hypothetical protein